MLAVSMSPPIAHYQAVQKRPKLSLQTSQLPMSYGTSSRGLSTIATPTAAVTPTTINTFTNTYELTHRPSPTTANASPSVLRITSGRDRLSRSQSPRPKRNEAAYVVNLPYGVKPILKNTPYPKVRNNSISASPRSSTRRVFFPAPKQVLFKSALEEVIVTETYTARHSDLLQEENVVHDEELSSEASDSEETSVSSEHSEVSSSITISSTKRRKVRRRNSLELGTSTTSSSETKSTSIATPSSTRKRRRWEWTLAPLPESQPATESKPEASSLPQPSSASDSKLVLQTDSTRETTSTSKSGSALSSPLPAQSRQDLAYKQPNLSSIGASSKPAKSRPQASRFSRAIALSPQRCPSILSPTLVLSHQKRADSLDGSPRKRKAECLELASSLNSSGDADHNGSAGEGGASSRQSSVKRRERAATL